MSKTRSNMDIGNRAKQFAPFAALKGHEMELAKQLKRFEERILLAEDEIQRINETLLTIDRGDFVKITYYKDGTYETIIGAVDKLLDYEASIQIKDKKIKLDDIYRIEKKGL